jgi:cytochrome c-type biogenesis protein CcmE
MKPKYIVGIAAALALIAVAVMSVESSKIEYMDFAAANASGRTAQIAGTWVKEKGQQYDADRNEFRFTMADESGAQMPVVLHAAKPNNFEMSVSVVATGRIEEGAFHATNVLTKCPSKYESGGEALKTQPASM